MLSRRVKFTLETGLLQGIDLVLAEYIGDELQQR